MNGWANAAEKTSLGSPAQKTSGKGKTLEGERMPAHLSAANSRLIYAGGLKWAGGFAAGFSKCFRSGISPPVSL